MTPMQTRATETRTGYTSPELCQLAEITYRQLDYWTRHGYLNPSVQEADGPGSRRRYSAEDVARARILGRLSQLGIKPRLALELGPGDALDLPSWLIAEIEPLLPLAA